MKIVCSHFIIALSFSALCIADDTSSTIALTTADLKSILELEVTKNRVDFGKEGYPRLEIKAMKGADPIIVTLPVRSQFATIMTYHERGEPGSEIETIHFWFSDGRYTHKSKFWFYSDNAMFALSGVTNGVYSEIATELKDGKGEIGYSIQITSTDKSRTNESSEPPTRPESKSK